MRMILERRTKYGNLGRTITTLVELNPDGTDGRMIAERQWQKPKLAPKPQQACDHGLFSDDAKQTDLLDLTRANGA